MAEEKINIATIEIDANQFIKSAEKAKKEIDALTDANKTLRKEGKADSKQFIQNDIALKELRKSYRQNTNAASALQSATKDLTNATNFEAKSVVEVTNERARLIKLSKSIKGETDAEIAQRNKLNQVIDKQTEFIREQSSSFVGSKDSIGEYRQGINSSILANTKLGQILNQGIDVYEQTQSTIRQVTMATKAQRKANTDLGGSANIAKNAIISTNGALKLFRLALISTGVGAIVVALGSLVAFLASTQEGIDKVNGVLRPLKELFGESLGILQDFGKAIFDAFSEPQKTLAKFGAAIKTQLVDRFNAVSSIIEGIITFDRELVEQGIALNAKANKQITDGVNSVTDSIKDRFDTAIDRGDRLAELDIEIAEGKNALILQEQKLRTEIKAANKDAEDTTKTLAEREAAAKRSVDASEELLQAQQSLLDKEIERKQLEAEASDTSREQQREINELIAKRGQLEEQALELQTTQTNKLNIIRRQVESEREKEQAEFRKRQNEIVDEQISKSQQELDLFIAQQSLKDKTLKDEVNTAREVAEQKKAIELQRFLAGKISETEYQTALLNIKRDFIGKEAELAAEEAERQEEKRQVELQKEAERNAIDQENRLALLRGNFQQELQLRREQLAIQIRVEIAEAKRTGADVHERRQKFKSLELELEKGVQQSKLEAVGQVAGDIAGILGEQTAAGKAFAVAQSLINTYQGITAALASAPPPINIALAATTAAKGFKSVKDIVSTKVPKAERGLLTGKSHAQGGQMIEAEGGESIINKKSTSMFAPILSAINQAGGGVGFAARGTMVGGRSFGGGIGATSRVTDSLINYDRLEQTFTTAVSKAPRPTVAVTEINETNRNYTKVVERANI